MDNKSPQWGCLWESPHKTGAKTALGHANAVFARSHDSSQFPRYFAVVPSTHV